MNTSKQVEEPLSDLVLEVRSLDQNLGRYMKLPELGVEEVLESPPKSKKDQVIRISAFFRHFKDVSGLTTDELLDSLPKKHKLSKTAFNAYLYGTVKTPPTRDFVLAVLSKFSISEEMVDLALEACGFSRVKFLSTVGANNPEVLLERSIISILEEKEIYDLAGGSRNTTQMLAQSMKPILEKMIEAYIQSDYKDEKVKALSDTIVSILNLNNER